MNNVHKSISYLTVDTLNVCYKDKAGNTVEENNSWLNNIDNQLDATITVY